MASKNVTAAGSGLIGQVRGDVAGAVVLTLLGVLHLFLLELGGAIGTVLLLVVWPLVGGVVGAYVDHTQRPERSRDLPLTGAVVGAFAMVATVLVVFITGLAGVWSNFIFNTFGVELLPVTLGMAILFAIVWTVIGFLGGLLTREVLT